MKSLTVGPGLIKHRRDTLKKMASMHIDTQHAGLDHAGAIVTLFRSVEWDLLDVLSLIVTNIELFDNRSLVRVPIIGGVVLPICELVPYSEFVKDDEGDELTIQAIRHLNTYTRSVMALGNWDPNESDHAAGEYLCSIRDVTQRLLESNFGRNPINPAPISQIAIRLESNNRTSVVGMVTPDTLKIYL